MRLGTSSALGKPMQSSPRAARETRIEGQETAELNDQAPVPDERWYSGLVRLFGGKSASQKTADTNAANPNALLAFPSEAISRPEPAAIVDAAKRAAQKTATPATAATDSPKDDRHAGDGGAGPAKRVSRAANHQLGCGGRGDRRGRRPALSADAEGAAA